ncbi:MAG: SWIM zinc finger family protein, partial [Clostridia bacterium]|nr:SWIM zinc finger family protein [Clostridia bacterium]
MQNLINALLSADDDYLTALSNKGTLKRAYKDLQSTEISAEYLDGCVCVSVSGEKCTIVPTLAESKCTCPSRSICRHIITAILWLKNNFLEKDESENIPVAENTVTVETVSEETTEISLPQNLTDELSAFPIKEIQKAMKKRYYNAFLEKAEKGIFPYMEELRMVTVDIPEENVIVKLINPLEYSACTCHSKEICRHKATAILTWQLKHHIVNLKDIKINDEKTLNIDIADIHDTAQYTYQFLADILSNGLVRISDDIVENTESIAVMCHNSRLANCERMTREIKNRLQAYVLRKPEFKAENLFSLIIETLLLLRKILHTKS